MPHAKDAKDAKGNLLFTTDDPDDPDGEKDFLRP